MFSKINNFEKNFKITRNILKRLKGKLIENGIPLPDVEDDQQLSEQLFSNATAQDKLEEALIGYQNVQQMQQSQQQQEDSKNTTQVSIMSGVYDPQVLSDYDKFVLKQLEKAQLRSLSKEYNNNNNYHQSRGNSEERHEFSSKRKNKNIDLNDSHNNFISTQQNQGKTNKREQRNVIVKKINKSSRAHTNIKQRAVSTGRGGINERLPRIKKGMKFQQQEQVIHQKKSTIGAPSSTLLAPGLVPPSLKKNLAKKTNHHSSILQLKQNPQLYYKIDSQFRQYISQKLLTTLSDAYLVSSEMQVVTKYFVANAAKNNFFHKSRTMLFDTITLFFLVRNVANNNQMEIYLPRMIEMLAALLQVERCAIYLYDRANDQLYCRVITGNVDDIDIAVKREQGIHGEAFSTGTPIYLKNAYEDPKFDNSIDTKLNFVTRNMLVVPILFGNKAIGVFELVNKHDGLEFSECDLAVVRSVAKETGIGITAFQMKQNIQKDMEKELQDVKGLIGESQNRYLKPLTTNLSNIIGSCFNCAGVAIYYHDRKNEQFFTFTNETSNTNNNLFQTSEQSKLNLLNSIEMHFKDTQGFAGQVNKNSSPLLDMDPVNSQFYFKSQLDHIQRLVQQKQQDLQSILAYPVFDQNNQQLIAVIQLFNLPKFTIINKSGGPSQIQFSQGSQPLLKMISNYISQIWLGTYQLASVLASNDLNQILLQSLNEGVLVLNNRGIITKVNQSVCLIFQKNSSQIVGCSAQEFFGQRNSCIFEILSETMARKQTITKEMCKITKVRSSINKKRFDNDDDETSSTQTIHANLTCINVHQSKFNLHGYAIVIQPVLKSTNQYNLTNIGIPRLQLFQNN